MISDIGDKERFIRLLLSIIITFLMLFDVISLKWVIVSAILALTAAFSFCPLYTIKDR